MVQVSVVVTFPKPQRRFMWPYLGNISHITKTGLAKCIAKRFRSKKQPSRVALRKLKKCRKFATEHPCRSLISIDFLCNFIEIAFRHGHSPVQYSNWGYQENLLPIYFLFLRKIFKHKKICRCRINNFSLLMKTLEAKNCCFCCLVFA